MPKLGEKTRDGRNKERTWTKCDECGNEFWSLGSPPYTTCARCIDTPGHEILVSGKKNKNKIFIKLAPTDPYYDMTMKRFGFFGRGWTTKARYVMAQTLGRCLESNEQVSHIDKNKMNFDPTNLKIRTVRPLYHWEEMGYNDDE